MKSAIKSKWNAGLFPALLTIAAMVAAPCTWAQSTSFTYQGQLDDSGIAVDGTNDMDLAHVGAPDIPVAYQDKAAYKILDDWTEIRGVGEDSIRIRKLKMIEKSTGEQMLITLDPRAISSSQYGTKSEARYTPASKIHPDLQDQFAKAIKTEGSEAKRTVIVWFVAPEAERAAIEAIAFPDAEPPEEEPEGPNRQQPQGDWKAEVKANEQANVLRRQQIAARFKAISQRGIDELKLPVDEIIHQYHYAPAVAIKLTQKQCQALNQSPLVNFMFPERQAKKELDIIGPASKGPGVWYLDGYTGSGVTIAHIEPDAGKMETANPYLNATIFRPAGALDAHSTAIGGIIRSTHSLNRGMATGCTLLSANADSGSSSHLDAATDWALGEGASVLNMSYKLKDSSDGELHWSDIYYDYMVHYSRVLFTKSAGNEGNGTGVITSPGRGYNSLAVGNVQDNGTKDWGNDTMRPSSSYVDPETGGDKPEIAAYGTLVDTTTQSSPWIGNEGSGTSYAAPLVAAMAGLCIDEIPGYVDEPATLKAKLMVSAMAHNIEGAARLSEYDGAGCAKATAINAGGRSLTLQASNFSGGYYEIPVDISLVAGVRERIVFVYTHPPSSQSATPDPSSYYRTDLDIGLYVNGSLVGSSTYGDRNAFEIIDYTPPTSGTGRIRVNISGSWHASVSSLRCGLAYGRETYFGDGPDLPELDYYSRTTDDDTSGQSSGNNDGTINPGESIETYITLRNDGEDHARNVIATLSTTSPYISFIDSVAGYGQIDAGATNASSDDFDFTVSSSCPHGHVANFTIDIDSDEGSWSDSFNVNVYTIADNYEENDTLATAYTGFPEATWLNTVDGYATQEGDDWYKIYITANYNRLVVECDFTHAEGDIDVAIYNSAGSKIVLSNTTTDDEFIDVVLPTSGEYYYIRAAGDGGNEYNLWWDDLNALDAPTGVAATDGSYSDKVRVTWDPVAGATHYKVWRATSASGVKTAASGWITGNYFNDTGATPGTTYYYFVEAAASSSGDFDSGYSAYNTGWRALLPPTPVSAGDGAYTDKIRVAWNSVTGASHYRVYRSHTIGGIKTGISGWQTSTSFDDTSATPGATYYYFVRAAIDDSATHYSGYSDYEDGWRALLPSTGVSASDGAYTNKIRVTWSSVTGASHYQLYRSHTAGGTKTGVIGWQTSTSFDDMSATPGTTYYYFVRAAIDEGGTHHSDYSAFDTGWRAGIAPWLAIAVAGVDEVTVSWTPDDPGWLLQEKDDLMTNWWDSASGSANPITIPATEAMIFYRLRKE